MDNNFIRTEIIEGLQKLFSLRLIGSPAEDILQVTGETWIVAFSKKTEGWKIEDEGRIEKAFNLILADIERWPSPKQVIALIPKRKKPTELAPPKFTSEQIAANKKRLAETLKIIVAKMEMTK
ncbi:hypothetical protein [Neisseria sp. Ec49-e6-T10]|uniref:hypothetical protein n=1 Tax=Neisseria sp. Ec49-e6-T10 TaxID=3140744 RepID=UPI003EB90B87